MFEVVDMPASGTRALNDVVFTREVAGRVKWDLVGVDYCKER